MDWEKKFNSILNDTKANLSRVKNKLEPPSGGGTKNVTWAPAYYSTPMKRSTSLSEIPPFSPNMYPQTNLSQSLHTDFYTPTNTSNIMPYPSTLTLMEKLEQQNAAIDHLRSLIHRLETDRHNYKEQIRDLRNEIFQLTERTGDRRPDPGMERRVEQVRRELLGEVQLLQSQLQMNSAKGNSSNLSDTQLLAMNRDVLEIKHAFRDELEGCRRDMEILRSRVSKLELELASVLTGKRDVERRQDNLDRTLNSLTHAQKAQVPSSALAMMNTNRQLEKLQISELRTTLRALQGKIDLLEQSQMQTQSVSNSTTKISPTSKPVFSNGFREFKDADGLLDDIDLSDDDVASSESSDFTEFEPQMGTTKSKLLPTKTKDRDGNLDPDDLDMDDLDFSDDDLSQNSLDDPLDNEDLT